MRHELVARPTVRPMLPECRTIRHWRNMRKRWRRCLGRESQPWRSLFQDRADIRDSETTLRNKGCFVHRVQKNKQRTQDTEETPQQPASGVIGKLKATY